jgi:hypothetical protein
MKKTKEAKEPKRDIYRDFTLDEYDQLTFEQQIIGAGWERGKIIAELERRVGQLREFSDKSDFVDGRDVFAQQARGMEMALRFIRNLREYEDNVGCPECEAGW